MRKARRACVEGLPDACSSRIGHLALAPRAATSAIPSGAIKWLRGTGGKQAVARQSGRPCEAWAGAFAACPEHGAITLARNFSGSAGEMMFDHVKISACQRLCGQQGVLPQGRSEPIGVDRPRRWGRRPNGVEHSAQGKRPCACTRAMQEARASALGHRGRNKRQQVEGLLSARLCRPAPEDQRSAGPAAAVTTPIYYAAFVIGTRRATTSRWFCHEPAG
jgi:hypothetical protein